MTGTATSTRPRNTPAAPTPAPPAPVTAGALLLGGVLVVGLSAAWHLTQGTSAVGVPDVLRALVGSADERTLDTLSGSRLPRMLAGLVVGLALGAAGAVFQSLARNPLASPDTLAVNSGAWLAVTLAGVTGLSLPLLGEGAVAFVGGAAAAAVVILLGGATSVARLVLAGSALTLAFTAVTASLLILFEEETTGLYAWGSGSLSQLGSDAVRQMAPLVGVAFAVAMLLTRRLDLLTLGDDTARLLGVPVLRTRLVGTGLAVLLSAAAVTLAGPIGFVGLCAPVIVRLLRRLTPVVARHHVLLPMSALTGAAIVLLADITVRSLLGAEEALRVPTGVATSLLGAVVLVALARRAGDGGGRAGGPTARPDGPLAVLRRRATPFVLAAAVLGAALLGLLGGYTWLLTGDLVVWAKGDAVPVVNFAMEERAPRVAAALLGGAALALSGTAVQSVCRNPLAEPGLLGITGGAGVGGALAVTLASSAASTAAIAVGTTIGALVAFVIVYGLSWRGGLESDRLVLVGIGVWFGSAALTTLIVLRANPWDTPRIFTWLSGSTYDRSWSQVLPVLVLLLVLLPLLWASHRELDLLAVDDDLPRTVGVRLEARRLATLTFAALLAAAAVCAVGVVGFVGLVAPHAARAVVGGRHRLMLPVAVLIGALILSLGDTIGRTVIAPAQVPAGLVVAIIGAPYFLHLLARSR